MPKREIEAPEADWLTEAEAIRYLRLNLLAWRHLVDSGWVLGEVRHSRECVLYPWEAVVLVSWRLRLGERPPPRSDSAKLDETGKKSRKLADTGEEV